MQSYDNISKVVSVAYGKCINKTKTGNCYLSMSYVKSYATPLWKISVEGMERGAQSAKRRGRRGGKMLWDADSGYAR
jgi:hypothetical protein